MSGTEQNTVGELVNKSIPRPIDDLRRFVDRSYFVPNPKRADVYLHSDHSKNFSSGDVQIPIAWKEWVHYYGKVIGGTSDRPISSYQVMLFPDIFLQEVYDPNSTLGYSIERFLNEATCLDNSTPIFGGYEGAFRAGKVVLDIASGEAIAAMQLALKFPKRLLLALMHSIKQKEEYFHLNLGFS